MSASKKLTDQQRADIENDMQRYHYITSSPANVYNKLTKVIGKLDIRITRLECELEHERETKGKS